MTILQTTADIIDNVLFRAGEPTDGTSDFNTHALNLVVRAYRAIWMGGGEFVEGMNEPWLWLKKDPPGVITFVPVRDEGAVDVTNNNATATLNAAAFLNGMVNTDLDGWFFKVDTHPDVFRISAHTTGSQVLTLDAPYTGPDGNDVNYKLMKLEYSLASDLLRLISPIRVQSDNEDEVLGIDLTALDRDYPLALVQGGTPDRFALVTETKIRVNRFGGASSEELIRGEYDYLQKPDDLTDASDSTPLVPLERRQLIADIALFYLFTDKADARAEALAMQAKAGLKSMAADNRARMQQIGRNFGAILPRQDSLGLRRRILRTTSGLILG